MDALEQDTAKSLSIAAITLLSLLTVLSAVLLLRSQHVQSPCDTVIENDKRNFTGDDLLLLHSMTSAPGFTREGRTRYNFIIDVSHHQGAINWAAVRGDGIENAYVKATQGNSFIDPRFIDNVTDARQNGLRIGAYHFLSSLTDWESQAKAFLAQYGPLRHANDLPPVLDLEWDVDPGSGADRWRARSCSEIIDTAVNWTRSVKEALGVSPLIYTNPAWWNQPQGCDIALLGDQALWISDYGRPSPFLFESRGQLNVQLWQFTNASQVDGINGDVDKSVPIDTCSKPQ